MTTINDISAIGTRGDAKGKRFVAKKDRKGYYILNRKKPSKSAFPTNRSVNKVFVGTLAEALELLATGNYLINLVSSDGKRALREYKKVRVEAT